MEAVAGIDVGTTRTKLVVYRGGQPVARESSANRVHIRGDAVEHDPAEILDTVRGYIGKALRLGAECIGFSTYRGSFLAWRRDGTPLTNVVTWMDKRSLRVYRELPLHARLASRLPVIGTALTPESPLVKLRVHLTENPGLARLLEEGRAYAWNIDSYILYSLTGVYVSDASNAALMGIIHPGSLRPVWVIARLLGVPRIPLPRVLLHDEAMSAGDYEIGGVMGDQQAASYGLGCLEEGCYRVSLGSGLFVDASTGDRLVMTPGKGLVPLILYRGRSERVYGLEGYIAGLGKAVEWFVDNLLGGDYGVLGSAARRRGVPRVYPFFWGLRHPRLNKGVAAVVGLEPGHSASDIAAGLAHAVAASVAYLTKLLSRKAGPPRRVLVTGGLSRVEGLVALIASYLERPVDVVNDLDASVHGAARLAAGNCGMEPPRPLEAHRAEPDPDVDVLDVDEYFDRVRAFA